MRIIDKYRIDRLEQFGYVIKRYKYFAVMRGYSKGRLFRGFKKDLKESALEITYGVKGLLVGLGHLIRTILGIFPTIYIESKPIDNGINVYEEN